MDVQLTDVPDYNWFAGCFGTASGNVAGYWDRHGFPDFYTGPTAGGVAPLSNCGTNIGIRSMWATKAGLDGRPTNLPGHVDDYWDYYTTSGSCGTVASYSYESTILDEFVRMGRLEHTPDCIGDFMGLSQRRWTNMNNECSGNVDAFAFVYWETNGTKRFNYVPPAQGTNPGRDVPSGLREWALHRGYDAEVFSQLVSFNPNCPAGRGFSFADLKAEIDAGYPVLAFLQKYNSLYVNRSGMPMSNPQIHGMVIYGYQVYEGFGTNVYCRDGYGGGEVTKNWAPVAWLTSSGLPLRGVIGFRPKPKMRSIARDGADLVLRWEGPLSQLYDLLAETTTPVHRYQVQRSLALNPPDFQPVGSPTTELSLTIPDCCEDAAFYRVELLPP
jgi:hypothetical protein